MRQLGARLPEPPRATTAREPQARPDARSLDNRSPDARSPDTRFPDTRFPDTRSEDRQVQRARLEQHVDFARDDSSIALEAVPRQEGTPWGLLEPEQEHRFPFLTVAVPGIAAVLALGALLWSGSLRDRVKQQDSAMNALQAQNQKLADTLEEMSVEQKASNALSASTGSQPSSSRLPASVPPPPRQQAAPPRSAQPAKTPEATQPPPQPTVQKTEAAPQTSTARAEAPSSQPVQEKAAAPQPQVKPVETAHAPEIVPPYPTNYRPLNATNLATASTAPSQAASTYHPPFSVAASNRAEPAPGVAGSSQTQQARTSAAAALPTANHRGATANEYDAAGNGLYASSLAENIEAVQGLQRHSTVPLQEFHVHEGMLTNVTPALSLSVRHPDPGHGTYSLLVGGTNGNYQLRGQVNNPLVFTDNTTHREYELIVLHIADRQVYGYVRAMR